MKIFKRLLPLIMIIGLLIMASSCAPLFPLNGGHGGSQGGQNHHPSHGSPNGHGQHNHR